VHKRVLPEPVQVPAVPAPVEAVEVDAVSAAAEVVSTAAAAVVAWDMLEMICLLEDKTYSTSDSHERSSTADNGSRAGSSGHRLSGRAYDNGSGIV
jgi:hypothetical protein